MSRVLLAVLTLVLAGCALGTSPAEVVEPSASPSAATAGPASAPLSPSVAAVTPTSATPTPPPAPHQWFTARFARVASASADTSPFDTRMRDAAIPSSGGVFSLWRDKNDYGKPYPKAFVIEAGWNLGAAPPPSKDRRLEMRFLEPPKPGDRFELRTDAVSRSTVQLTYHQGYRFHQDVWAATRGTLAVDQADGETVRLTISNAAMAPDPRGGDYESKAAGTFEVDGEGVVLPKDAYDRTETYRESPSPSSLPTGPDLNGTWTFAIPGATPTPIPACGAAYRRLDLETREQADVLNGATFEDFTISPDGSKVVVSTLNSAKGYVPEYQALEPETGAMTPLGGGPTGATAWMPDGTGLIVVGHAESTLSVRRFPLAGKPTEPKHFPLPPHETNGAPQLEMVAPDGRHIAAYYGDRNVVISLETGEMKTLDSFGYIRCWLDERTLMVAYHGGQFAVVVPD